MKQLFEKAIISLANTAYVQAAIRDKADLSAFRAKPTVRILSGVALIILSFLLGWPAVALMGFLSLHFANPWFLAVGGPVVYAFSHLVFLFGMYLSGAQYTLIFCRWLTRRVMERSLTWVQPPQSCDQR